MWNDATRIPGHTNYLTVHQQGNTKTDVFDIEDDRNVEKFWKLTNWIFVCSFKHLTVLSEIKVG